MWLLATATTIGSAGVLTLYLALIDGQGNRPVGWAVAILVLGMVLPLAGAAFPRAGRVCFAVCGSLLTILSVLAGLSIGLLLLPFALLAWVAFGYAPPFIFGALAVSTTVDDGQ
jgi:hypothetical protein